MVGQTLGHFRITARLGSGGMGIVYRAHDEKLDRTVAIKVIGRETAITPVDRARIVEEARASSALSHPNICTVYEIGEIDGQAYIAMEYVEGRPLSELIPVNGLPPEVVVRYGAEIADALEHAHVRGVVHRDLKTPNVVISADGRAKVLDFGLARRIPSKVNEAVTRTNDRVAMGPFAGTLPYMPPELLLGQDADERSDIWSFGVTVFEMATGELPFKGRNEFELTAAILRSPPQPLPAQVPPMIRSVIQRCLSKDPAHRYQRAGEARAALEASTAARLVGRYRGRRTRADRSGWVVALPGAPTTTGRRSWRRASDPCRHLGCAGLRPGDLAGWQDALLRRRGCEWPDRSLRSPRRRRGADQADRRSGPGIGAAVLAGR
jgi:serine/threonine protein kinase